MIDTNYKYQPLRPSVLVVQATLLTEPHTERRIALDKFQCPNKRNDTVKLFCQLKDLANPGAALQTPL